MAEGTIERENPKLAVKSWVSGQKQGFGWAFKGQNTAVLKVAQTPHY